MPSLIAKPTKPLPRETTSKYDEALLLLERCLPETPSRLWISSDGIVGLFKKGGLDFSKTFISRALKSNKNNSRRWAMNKFLTKRHYCFPGECAMTFDSPKDQRDFLKAATTEDKKERICPSIPEGYFLDFKLKHLDKFRCKSVQLLQLTVLHLLHLHLLPRRIQQKKMHDKHQVKGSLALNDPQLQLQEILPPLLNFNRLQAIPDLLPEMVAAASVRSCSSLPGY